METWKKDKKRFFLHKIESAVAIRIGTYEDDRFCTASRIAPNTQTLPMPYCRLNGFQIRPAAA